MPQVSPGNQIHIIGGMQQMQQVLESIFQFYASQLPQIHLWHHKSIDFRRGVMW